MRERAIDLQELYHAAAGVDSDRCVPHPRLVLDRPHMRQGNTLHVRAPEAPTPDEHEAAIRGDQDGRLAALDPAVTHTEHLLTRFQNTREHRHLAARGLAGRARQVGRVHADRIDGDRDGLQSYRWKYFLKNHLAAGVSRDRRYASPALRKASA